jgi:hypothetical protein
MHMRNKNSSVAEKGQEERIGGAHNANLMYECAVGKQDGKQIWPINNR